jgi:raffinose/stachyose/melibiose transport system permease protein
LTAERPPGATRPPPTSLPGTASPAPRTGSNRAGAAWGRRATIIAFLAPALALYVLLALVPIFQAAFYSGFDWNGLEPLDQFVGPRTSDAPDPVPLRHVLVILVLSLVLQLPFALGLAVLLNQRMRGRALLRLLFFLPFVLSDVITAIVWRRCSSRRAWSTARYTAASTDSCSCGWPTRTSSPTPCLAWSHGSTSAST